MQAEQMFRLSLDSSSAPATASAVLSRLQASMAKAMKTTARRHRVGTLAGSAAKAGPSSAAGSACLGAAVAPPLLSTSTLRRLSDLRGWELLVADVTWETPVLTSVPRIRFRRCECSTPAADSARLPLRGLVPTRGHAPTVASVSICCI